MGYHLGQMARYLAGHLLFFCEISCHLAQMIAHICSFAITCSVQGRKGEEQSKTRSQQKSPAYSCMHAHAKKYVPLSPAHICKDPYRHTRTWKPYCTTLQHTAPHCNILHHIAKHCSTLQQTRATSGELRDWKNMTHQTTNECHIITTVK